MIKTKITSSLENIFPDEDLNKYPEITHISALRGEKISLQLIYSYIKDDDEIYMRKELAPRLSGGLAEYAKLRKAIREMADDMTVFMMTIICAQVPGFSPTF